MSIDPITAVFAVASIGAGLISAGNSLAAGAEDDVALREEADEEEIIAMQDEADRRLELRNLQATNRANAGASNRDTSGVGSFLTFQAENERIADIDIGRIRFLGASRSARLRREGRNARAAGRSQAVGAVVGSVAGAASSFARLERSGTSSRAQVGGRLGATRSGAAGDRLRG